MKIKQILLIYFILLSLISLSEPSVILLQKKNYVEKYADIAILQMWNYGIPASITLAQAVLESKTGSSPLAKYANNHFGIKCKKEWSGDEYYMKDDKPNECFRKYESVEASFEDHSKFLKYRPYYQSLFELSIYDYKAWAKGLKKAGYATNPSYAKLLIDIIEDLELTNYDKIEMTHDFFMRNKMNYKLNLFDIHNFNTCSISNDFSYFEEEFFFSDKDLLLLYFLGNNHFLFYNRRNHYSIHRSDELNNEYQSVVLSKQNYI